VLTLVFFVGQAVAQAASTVPGYPVVVWMIVIGCFLLWSTTWSDRPRAHA
jgi:hypothetical protein